MISNLLIAPSAVFSHVLAMVMTRFGPEGKMGSDQTIIEC
jgi:hypothetical protein